MNTSQTVEMLAPGNEYSFIDCKHELRRVRITNGYSSWQNGGSRPQTHYAIEPIDELGQLWWESAEAYALHVDDDAARKWLLELVGQEPQTVRRVRA